MRNLKGEKGITLISLVVTIVVILILSTVTMNMTLGEEGLLKKSKEIHKETEDKIKHDDKELNHIEQDFLNALEK